MSLTNLYTLATIIASAVGLVTLLFLYFTRRKPNTCLNCQYPRENLPPAAPCPECGLVHNRAALAVRQRRRGRILGFALILLVAFPLGGLAYTTVRSLWWRVAYPRWVTKEEVSSGSWTVRYSQGGRPDTRTERRLELVHNQRTILDRTDVALALKDAQTGWPDLPGFERPDYVHNVDVTDDGMDDLIFVVTASAKTDSNAGQLCVLTESALEPIVLSTCVRSIPKPVYFESLQGTNVTKEPMPVSYTPAFDARPSQHDESHRLHITDPTLEPGSALAGDASPPSIALVWNGTTLEPSAVHTRWPTYGIPASHIVDIELAANPVTAPWPPQALRQRIVELFYAGYEPLAEEVLAEVTRRTGHDMTDYLTSLRTKLNSSPYWPTLKAQFDQLRVQTPIPESTPN